jgi:hypothetical protein
VKYRHFGDLSPRLTTLPGRASVECSFNASYESQLWRAWSGAGRAIAARFGSSRESVRDGRVDEPRQLLGSSNRFNAFPCTPVARVRFPREHRHRLLVFLFSFQIHFRFLKRYRCEHEVDKRTNHGVPRALRTRTLHLESQTSATQPSERCARFVEQHFEKLRSQTHNSRTEKKKRFVDGHVQKSRKQSEIERKDGFGLWT